MTGSPGRRGIFASLSIRNYRFFFWGQAASSIGKWVQNLALSWYVLQIGESPIVLGLTIACRYVPALALGPWAGLVVDRRGQRSVMTVTQIFGSLLSLAFAALIASGSQSLLLLLIFTTAVGVWDLFDVPARQSMIPSLVPLRLVGNAVALNSIANNLNRALGPAIAGVLIATIGVSMCMAVNAACQVISLAAIKALRVSEMTTTLREQGRGGGQVRSGVRLVRRDQMLRGPMLMVVVTGLFTWEYPVSIPLLMTDTFDLGSAAFGAAMACFGAGALVGSVLAARKPLSTLRELAWTSLMWGVATFAVGLAPTVWATFVALALAGIFAVIFSSAAKTILQMRAAPEFRGRVMALWFVAWQGSTVLGAPLTGLMATWPGGARTPLLVGGVAAMAIGLVFLRRARGFRENVLEL
jgi:MFS family permease